MANKRMLDKSIMCSDAFIGLNPLSQCLYIQMNMNADDDGFVNNIVSLSRIIGCSKDNIKELVDEKFILDMGKGIFVIKHWFINNTIRKDRYCPTKYQELLKTLYITSDKKYRFIADQNNEDDDSIVVCDDSENYTEDTDSGYTSMATDNVATQYRVVENSIDKDSIDTHTDIYSDINKAENNEKKSCMSETPIHTQCKVPDNYARIVFDILKDNNLPCSNGNYAAFSMRDFYQALPCIHDLKLSSDEVIQAVKNYADVCNVPDSWWTSRQDFYHFCSNKTILKFIPGNFNIKQYENKTNMPKNGSMIHQLGYDKHEGEMPF